MALRLASSYLYKSSKKYEIARVFDFIAGKKEPTKLREICGYLCYADDFNSLDEKQVSDAVIYLKNMGFIEISKEKEELKATKKGLGTYALLNRLASQFSKLSVLDF